MDLKQSTARNRVFSFTGITLTEVRDTATQAKLRNSANSGDLATHALSDSGGTFTSGPAT